jgi:hypothetical protein
MARVIDLFLTGWMLYLTRARYPKGKQRGIWLVTGGNIMTGTPSPAEGLSPRTILHTYWPLAFSWLLMSVEIPAVSAVIARLANPEINLAAYGGVVFPMALIIEAPVIMLLAGSTALSRHRQAYQRIWQFMMISSVALTLLHIVVAFTPLYYFVVSDIIGVPAEIVEPARLGLMLMTPWTWAIAYRRFQQGVMIRFGHSGAVGIGTIVRLVTGGLTLLVGYNLQTIPGVAVGAAAQALGVMAEAFYAGWRVRPVLNNELRQAEIDTPLTWKAFFDFYIPLALTSLILLLWQPVGSAALSRMPQALTSLAVWPVLSGLTFLVRSFGIAFNEVVVSLLDRERSLLSLKRFSTWLALGSTGIHLLMVVTPLSWLYFTQLSALPAPLAELARVGLLIALPLPALSVYQNWFQGTILFGKQTRAIPESVVVFFGTVLLVLGAGVIWGSVIGLYVGMTALVAASMTQVIWLWIRSRAVMVYLRKRDLE